MSHRVLECWDYLVSMPTRVYIFGDTSFFFPTGSKEWLDGHKLINVAFDTCAVAISAFKFPVIGGQSDQKQVEELESVTS